MRKMTRGWPRFGLALLLAGSLAGCAEAEASSPLADAAPTQDALVRSVLEALAAKDQQKLRSLLVTKEEYEGLLWPEMPDGEYTPFSFVWSLTEVNSRKGLRQLLGTYGGLELELVSISFDEDPEEYEHFTLYPGAKVKVRRRDTGEEGIFPTFDVFVKYGRGWKLMNYDEL